MVVWPALSLQALLWVGRLGRAQADSPLLAILHLLDHLSHVGDPQLAVPVLLQKPKLLGCDLIFLELPLRGMEGTHVTDKVARDTIAH